MQNVYTPPARFRRLHGVSLYSAAPSAGCAAAAAVLRVVHRRAGGCSMRTPTENGFCSSTTPAPCTQLERVARRVPARQHDAPRGDALCAAGAHVARISLGERAVLEAAGPFELRVEPHLAARFDDLAAQGAAPRPRAGRSRCAASPARGSPRARPRPRTTAARARASGFLMFVVSLPSENVPAPPSPNWMFVCGVERAAGARTRPRRQALVHVAAALQHERPQPGARQVERAEQPRRPRAHHHRARLAAAVGPAARGTRERLVGRAAADVRARRRLPRRRAPRLPRARAPRPPRSASSTPRVATKCTSALLARVHAALEHRAPRVTLGRRERPAPRAAAARTSALARRARAALRRAAAVRWIPRACDAP